MLHETYKKVVIACFDVNSSKSVFYRGYKSAEKAMNRAVKMIEEGKVDYISVRIIGRQKIIPLEKFIEEETIPLNAPHHTKPMEEE